MLPFPSTTFRLFVLLLFTLVPSLARACQCSGPDPSKTPWQLAKLYTDGAALVFEGTPAKVQIEWNAIRTTEGTFVPATLGESAKAIVTGNRPHMVITFRVQRVYKGEAGSEVQVHTGFGGGDCGAQFSSGLTYLLFLLPQTDGTYGVSMCSPGGWALGPQVQSQLRYLRGETPAPDDLVLPKRWSPERSKEEIELEKKDAARFNAVAAEQTGTICGRVERDAELRAEWGDVRLLSLLGYSPVQQPTAYLEDNGTFCAKYLGPGKYKLRFESRDAFAYFPSTSSWDDAETIEVEAGRTLSGITIKPIRHETYSVSGSLSIECESELSEATVHIVLVSEDPVGPGSGRVESMEPVRLFGKRFFLFTGVRPGRYVAIATVSGSNWLSTKMDLIVSSGSQFISLQMKPAK